MVRRKRVVGYFAWELPAIPPNWKKALDLAHEIWVPSRFTADAFRPYTALPVRVVPHPVRCPTVADLARADFGLPEDAFVVLTMFHMGAGFVRKNPIGAVRAFRQAFGDNLNAVLVIKVADADLVPWAMAELQSAIGSAPNIRIFHDKLSRDRVAALIRCADVVLSLHRAEGFGLVPAQAMLLGKPVIATGWSGNTDFMNQRNSVLVSYKLVPVRDPQESYTQEDQAWADPDVEQAAVWLRRLAENPELKQRLGEAATKDAARCFSVSSYALAISGSIATPWPAPLKANGSSVPRSETEQPR